MNALKQVLPGIIVLSACVATTKAQPFVFTVVEPQFTELDFGAAGYADLDEDGDFDVVAAGNSRNLEPYEPVAFVALSQGDRTASDGRLVHDFEVSGFDFNVWHSDMAWLDWDRDGALDFVLTGTQQSGASYENMPHSGDTRIYRNRRTQGFQNIGATLTGVYGGSVAVGDYDNDGNEDVLVSGLKQPGVPKTQLHRNDDGSFERVDAGFADVALGDAEWVDYDGDGDLDLMLTGVTAASGFETHMYRNDLEMGFTDIDTGLPEYAFSAFDWGDYDNDGDLDLVMSGGILSIFDFLKPETDVFRNDGGQFTAIGAGIKPLLYGSVGWGDYDSDGDLDLIAIGADDVFNGRVGRVYENTGTGFTARVQLPGVSASSVIWGDYDGDDDLDVLIAGNNLNLHPLLRLYRNDVTIVNTPPEPPSQLNSSVDGAQVRLSWGPGSDEQTPANGLTYNLYVRPESGPHVVTAKADLESGKRQMPGRGNADAARQRTVVGLKNGTYFWSVQSVDHSFVGSEFAEEGTFTITAGRGGRSTATETDLPAETALYPGYPNPFGESTQIGYSVAGTVRVRLTVYNVLGARVKRLVDETKAAGMYRVTWDGKDGHGRRMGSGIYFVRMEAGGRSRMQPLTVVR